MASKKLKKALALGLGVGLGAKFLAGKARAASIATNEAKEAGFANTSKKFDYITKKVKTPVKKPDNSFMGKVKKAVNVYKEKGLNTGRGPKIKPTDSLANNYKGITDYMSKGGVTMVKARGGKLVNLKPTKMS